MKAIQTRVHSPGHNTPARITAFDCDGNRVSVTDGQAEARGLSLYSEAGARFAARQLCRKMGWKGRLACGWTRAGHVFVFVD